MNNWAIKSLNVAVLKGSGKRANWSHPPSAVSCPVPNPINNINVVLLKTEMNNLSGSEHGRNL